MPPFCEKHQIHYVYDYVDGLPFKTCFCEQCRLERTAAFNPLPKAIKATELPSKAAAVEGILTEEELKEWFEEKRLIPFSVCDYRIKRLIGTVREITERNRLLVLENDELSSENYKLREGDPYE